jgi:hypothetical protein
LSDESTVQLELVANIWPIVDATSGCIQRIAARAYAVPAGDDEFISRVLTALAVTDFALAKQYPISQRFKWISEYGELSGVVSVDEFNRYDQSIITPVLDELAGDRPEIVGIAMVDGEPQGVRPKLQFAKDPYTVTTFLIEDANGNLYPQVNRS